MTPRLDVRAVLAGHSRLDLLEHAAIVALLAIWAVPFTRATGGRGVHNELLFAAALLILLPAIRVWRAPTRSVVLAAVTAAAALLVCVFAPSGWYGSDVAAGYAIGAAAFVAARRYVRDEDRRMLIAAAILSLSISGSGIFSGKATSNVRCFSSICGRTLESTSLSMRPRSVTDSCC